jgi:hypothetical protein
MNNSRSMSSACRHLRDLWDNGKDTSLPELKVVIAGDQSSGKSTLMERYEACINLKPTLLPYADSVAAQHQQS